MKTCDLFHHLTLQQAGLLLYYLKLTRGGKSLLFQNGHITAEYLHTSKDKLYRTVRELEKAGWMERVENKQPRGAHGLWQRVRHKVLDHPAWTAKHGVTGCTNATGTGCTNATDGLHQCDISIEHTKPISNKQNLSSETPSSGGVLCAPRAGAQDSVAERGVKARVALMQPDDLNTKFKAFCETRT